MNTSYVILIFCIVVEPYLIDGLSVGDSCQVARSGAQGVCKVINNCQPVIDDIVKQGLFPSQCGFVGRDQIVCCPIPVSDTTTTTTTPRPSRISQRSKLDLVILKSITLLNGLFQYKYSTHMTNVS